MQTAKKTPKTLTIAAIVDYIVETYRPHKEPAGIVLMWRETINGFNRGFSPDIPIWTRDDRATHEHWKQFGPQVLKILCAKYRLIPIRVNGRIRDLVKHGGRPDRSGKRDRAAYLDCLPSSVSPTRGVVLFPRGASEDHPLVVGSLDRRGRTVTTALTNTVKTIDTAKDYRVLSEPEHHKIRGGVVAGVQHAIEDRYPLFKQLPSPEPKGGD